MTSRKFAVLHSFPGLAEQESAERVVIAARRMGMTAKIVQTHEDIAAFDPEFVLCLTHHEIRPPNYPTYGIVMAPLSWVRDDAQAIRHILSYDGYLTLSDSIRAWLEDLAAAIHRPALVEPFFPSVYATEWAPPGTPPAMLAYVGTNWDGWRSFELFQTLSRRGDTRFFGPADRWSHIPAASYGGAIPFDGRSVLETYAAAGIGLGLDRPDFTPDDLPSNRIFEISAAGAVGMMADIPFIRRHFGDAVLSLDHAAPAAAIAWQIDRYLAWIKANPEAAREKAREAHAIFNRHFSLERLLPNLLTLHDRARALGRVAPTEDEQAEIAAFCDRWTGAHRPSARRMEVVQALLGPVSVAPGTAVCCAPWPWINDAEITIEAHIASPPEGSAIADVTLCDAATNETLWSAAILPEALTAFGNLHRARIAVPAPLAAGRNVALHLRSRACLPLEVVSLILRTEFSGQDEPLSAVAAQGPIWIYGTGEGGRKVAAELMRQTGTAPAGFLDNFRDGMLDGIPVSTPDAARGRMRPQDGIILATQHWDRLWPQLGDLPPQRAYTAHPHYGAQVRTLPRRHGRT